MLYSVLRKCRYCRCIVLSVPYVLLRVLKYSSSYPVTSVVGSALSVAPLTFLWWGLSVIWQSDIYLQGGQAPRYSVWLTCSCDYNITSDAYLTSLSLEICRALSCSEHFDRAVSSSSVREHLVCTDFQTGLMWWSVN